MKITILATGKKRSDYDEYIAEYTKRITKPFELETIINAPAGIDNPALAIRRENEQVLSQLPANAYVIALDERGRDITTADLSAFLDKHLNQSTEHIVFVIGGAYGIDDAVRARANMIIRISSMTLPHEMARLILTEQLYRATNILAGGKYHH